MLHVKWQFFLATSASSTGSYDCIVVVLVVVLGIIHPLVFLCRAIAHFVPGAIAHFVPCYSTFCAVL
jgi:hypothetical protein